LGQLVLNAQEFVDLVAHMDRDTDGASLVSNSACHGLADPPGGIGAEFMTAAIVEFLGGPDETDIAFLDQVKEGYAASHIFFGDADHQARVGFNEVFTRRPTVFDEFTQFDPAARS
jgi:hypothetical protein